MASEASFIPFSRELYRLAELEREVLFLQDRYGLNVNVLLFCLWHSHLQSPPLSNGFFERVVSALEQWHEGVVLPVRRARRFLKSVSAPLIGADEREILRKQVLSAEIALEEGEQKTICRSFDLEMPDAASSSPSAINPECGRSSLRNYAQVQRAEDVPEVRESLEKLLQLAARRT